MSHENQLTTLNVPPLPRARISIIFFIDIESMRFSSSPIIHKMRKTHTKKKERKYLALGSGFFFCDKQTRVWITINHDLFCTSKCSIVFTIIRCLDINWFRLDIKFNNKKKKWFLLNVIHKQINVPSFILEQEILFEILSLVVCRCVWSKTTNSTSYLTVKCHSVSHNKTFQQFKNQQNASFKWHIISWHRIQQNEMLIIRVSKCMIVST